MSAQPAKRGMKVGQPNPQGFQKGHDPRRSKAGWSNVHKQQSVEDQFKIHTAEAIKVLRQLMTDPDQPASARAKCATELLDRAYGKAVDRQVVATLDESSITGNVRSLSDKQLLQIALQGVTTDSDETTELIPDLDVVSEQ